MLESESDFSHVPQKSQYQSRWDIQRSGLVIFHDLHNGDYFTGYWLVKLGSNALSLYHGRMCNIKCQQHKHSREVQPFFLWELWVWTDTGQNDPPGVFSAARGNHGFKLTRHRFAVSESSCGLGNPFRHCVHWVYMPVVVSLNISICCQSMCTSALEDGYVCLEITQHNGSHEHSRTCTVC